MVNLGKSEKKYKISRFFFGRFENLCIFAPSELHIAKAQGLLEARKSGIIYALTLEVH